MQHELPTGTVTLLFTDIEGSTRLLSELGAEAYEEALAEYETFLARADTGVNQLEIEKVNLRLPLLRSQIKRGEGVKKDKRAQ